MLQAGKTVNLSYLMFSNKTVKPAAFFFTRKKDPLQDQEVHHQEGAVALGNRGVGAFGADLVEPVTVFTLS